MTSETNAERLRGLKDTHRRRVRLSSDSIDWLIQQAERAQELDQALSDENELHNKMYDKAVELDRENARLREALEFYALKGCCTDAGLLDDGNRARQALKGESE